MDCCNPGYFGKVNPSFVTKLKHQVEVINFTYHLSHDRTKPKAISLLKSRKMGSVLKKSLSLGVAGKLDNIRNQWSNIAFAFALVWFDHLDPFPLSDCERECEILL